MQAFAIKWAIIILVPMILGAGGMWKYKDAQVKVARVELKVEQEAHAKDRMTIQAQKEEILKATSTCTTRIIGKDKLIKEFERILKLKGASNATCVGGGDILSELNSLYKAGVTDGIRQTDNPAPTPGR